MKKINRTKPVGTAVAKMTHNEVAASISTAARGREAEADGSKDDRPKLAQPVKAMSLSQHSVVRDGKPSKRPRCHGSEHLNNIRHEFVNSSKSNRRLQTCTIGVKSRHVANRRLRPRQPSGRVVCRDLNHSHDGPSSSARNNSEENLVGRAQEDSSMHVNADSIDESVSSHSIDDSDEREEDMEPEARRRVGHIRSSIKNIPDRDILNIQDEVSRACDSGTLMRRTVNLPHIMGFLLSAFYYARPE